MIWSTPDVTWHNRVVLDLRHPRPHVESFFLKANDPSSRRAVWLRLTLLCSGGEVAGETWAIVFDGETGSIHAAKEQFPSDRIYVHPEWEGLGIGECSVEDGKSWGVVRGRDVAVSWDIDLEDRAPPYFHLPAPWLYSLPVLSAKICTPHPNARLRGQLEIWSPPGAGQQPRVLSLDGWHGMQGHNWGRRHTERYAWIHCNLFADQSDGYFEAFAAQVRVGRWLLPPVVMGRLVMGQETYRFDTFQHIRFVPTEFGPGRWQFCMTGPDMELQGAAASRPEDTVGLRYRNPDGPVSFCHNSKLASLDLTLRVRGRLIGRWHSEQAALEVTQPQPSPSIRMML